MSSDGVNWTDYSTPFAMTKICFSEEKKMFVAVQEGTTDTAFSFDCKNWTTLTSAAAYTWRDVAYGNGTFCAVSDNGTTTQRVMTASAKY